MKVILEEYLISIVEAAGERIERCEVAMRDLLSGWRLEPEVQALMAMKGFQIVAAMILVSELGAIDRFAHPRQVMAYLGLIPSENTSSDKRRQGAITKCGNAHARWLLVECAQHYVRPPKVSKELSRRGGRSTARGPGDQLAGPESLARSFCAAHGTPAPTQQGIGCDRARALRFCLGAVAHPSLLPGAEHFALKKGTSSRGTVN